MFGETRPSWANLAKLCQHGANFASMRLKLGQLWSNLGQLGANIWAPLVDFGPRGGQFRSVSCDGACFRHELAIFLRQCLCGESSSRTCHLSRSTHPLRVLSFAQLFCASDFCLHFLGCADASMASQRVAHSAVGAQRRGGGTSAGGWAAAGGLCCVGSGRSVVGLSSTRCVLRSATCFAKPPPMPCLAMERAQCAQRAPNFESM